MAYKFPWGLNTKIILVEKNEVILFNPLLGDKKIHTFPKGICPKMNVIVCTGIRTSILQHHSSKNSPQCKEDFHMNSQMWVNVFETFVSI